MDRLRQIMTREGLDVIIITDRYNMNYLTGYMGDTGMVLIFADETDILTDSRYTEIAQIESVNCKVIDIASQGYSKTIRTLIETKYSHDIKLKIGFENKDISYMQYQAFVKEFGSLCELICLDDKVIELRQIKTHAEIEKIARAEEIGDMAFSHILSFIKAGMTEMQVGLELEMYMKTHGATGLSFDTIAASGSNSSLPHAVLSDKKLKAGDFLTMDFGCVYKGYCSDMTRTVFIERDEKGKKAASPSNRQLEVYNTVLRAQLASLELIKPGAKCSDIDAKARGIIKEAGYGDYFGHGLGHSVGLFIHEEPRLSQKCDTILQPGMTITVEPGIYLPGEFGVRIEDLLVVTENGYRNLSSSTKELILI